MGRVFCEQAAPSECLIFHPMLRILYIACDVLAALCAVISPVIIFHWLLLIVNVPLLNPHLVHISQFLNPMNLALDALFHLPPILYNGQRISMTQGVLAFAFTLAFFLLNFISEYLKTTEQQQEIQLHAGLQRERLKKLQDAQNRHQKKVATNRRYLVHVSYEFALCPAGGELLAKAFTRQLGSTLEQSPAYMTLEFPSLSQSIQYCMESGQALLRYYATLRPMDAQPPFRIGLHALDANLPTSDACYQTRILVSSAGPNDVVFSQNVLEVLLANGLAQNYHYQSIGLFGTAGSQQELFKLFNSKPGRTF
ncbi:hypothetical protein [Vampirovibrio sp.]|uniref:hypothetical protein n=1 Tax=Vampirovibrio sp. TaxID=2717857 RepID=UPI00359314BD